MRNPFRKLRYVKWWFQRANRKLPPCDWWDYKYTLADFIKQGLKGLLYEGVTDWDSNYHKKEKQDLEFVLSWATEFPYYESAIVALNDEDFEAMKKRFQDADTMVITEKEYLEFQKKTEKAFKLLAKHYSTLWD